MSWSLRPMLADDVPGATRLAGMTFDEQDRAAGRPVKVPFDDPVRLGNGLVRVGAAVASDPAGAWVAVDGAGLLGAALALRRGGLWVLSLLVVRPGSQGLGVGAALLSAARDCEAGASAGLIFSSSDPRALRRYQAAGFALQPAYQASGVLSLAGRPDGALVRPGSVLADAALCSEVAVAVRGVPHGDDLVTLERMGQRLLVAPDGGFAMLRGGGVSLLAAVSEEVARSLLWAALAEVAEPGAGSGAGSGEALVQWLTAAQPWAVDVCLAARLSLSPGPSVCVKGAVGPMVPYLPSGLFG